MLWRPAFAAAALACLLPACSSAPDEKPSSTPAPADTSVFDACADFAARLCADAQNCCEQAYSGFEQAACEDDFKRHVCRPGADAVAAGKAVFNADSIEGCLQAHAEAHAVCFPTWADTLALRKRIYTACRVIDGLTEPGRGCGIAAACKRPEGVATVECVKSVCVAIEILPEGSACPFPSGLVSVCDEGLACDAPLGGEGHCVPAPATGAECTGGMLESTECGLGSHCAQDSATCQVTTNMGGSGCEQGTECVSFDCDRNAHQCREAPAVVSEETCLGRAATP